MARRHRIRFAGATYHVMSRGNRRTFTFQDDIDRNRFLKVLEAAVHRYGAVCLAFCLMGNHYHLVIQTPRGNISQVMRHINGLYTQYCNWRHRWTGHVFEGRFASIVIDDDAYLRNAMVYVVRNPVEAGLVDDARAWKWSSYRAALGLCATPAFLSNEWLQTLFPSDTIESARRMFADIVDSRPDEEVNAFGLRDVEGPEAFQAGVRALIGSTMYRAALPRAYRALGRPPLDELFLGIRKRDRRSAVLRAHVVHGYQMGEIAGFLELHPSTVSRIVNQSGSYARS